MELNDTTNTDTENNEQSEYGGQPDEEEVQNTTTTNYEGGESFTPRSPERKLYKRTTNNMLENTYYEDDETLFNELVNAFDEAADSDPDFVLNIAAYARQELGMRDVPQLLLALAANDDRFKTHPPEPGHHNDTRIRDYTPEVVQRMDETATVVSIYFNIFDKDTIPHPLKKGLNDAINRMVDEYTLGKYTLSQREVNLHDVFNVVRPNPYSSNVENIHGVTKEEREKLFERFMRGELDSYPSVEPITPPSTWEVVISEHGNTEEAWRSVLPDMGIMAKIRNIRNMLEVGLTGEEMFDDSDIYAVENHRMFPFRFYQAYKAYQSSPEAPTDVEVENFLTEAIENTSQNLPKELENSLVVADISGSMRQPVSGKSNLHCDEIACFFAAVASKAGADIGAFADDFKETSFHNQTPALDRVEQIKSMKVGGSTNGYKVFDTLQEQDREYENVVLLTDEQLWDSSLENYPALKNEFDDQRTLKDAVEDYSTEVTDDFNLFILDLQAYETLSMPDGYENVYQVSGWNEKILEYIGYADDEHEILQEIKTYNPT